MAKFRLYNDLPKDEKGPLLIFLMGVINTIAVVITLLASIWLASNFPSAKAIIVGGFLFFLFIIYYLTYLYWMQLPHKKMMYCINPYISIVDTDYSLVTPTFLSNLEVKYKTVQVKSLYHVLIEFQNVGNRNIEPDDFKSKGITVGFGAEMKILGTSMKVNDRILEVVMRNNDPNIVIDPFVSKPNETITLRVFLETKPNTDNINVTVDGFPLRHLEHPNEKNKKILQRTRNVSYGTTLFLFIVSFAVLLIILLTKLNVWVLVTSVTFLSLLYLGFITIKVSNAVFMNLTKQPKI